MTLIEILKTGIIQVPIQDWLSLFIEHVTGNIKRRYRVKALKIIPAIKFQTNSCSNSTIETGENNYFFPKVNIQRTRMKFIQLFCLDCGLWTNVTFFSTESTAGYKNRRSKALHLGINQTEFKIFLVKYNSP